jgi:hypothetical protein
VIAQDPAVPARAVDVDRDFAKATTRPDMSTKHLVAGEVGGETEALVLDCDSGPSVSGEEVFGIVVTDLPTAKQPYNRCRLKRTGSKNSLKRFVIAFRI